jgi:carboxyl-terminal processing protease
MKKLILIPLMLITFSSCEKMILGKEEANNPINNYELFWNDIDQHYGLFTVRNKNWDSINTVFKPKVTASTTDAQLFNIFSQMIEYLDDSHTYIGNPAKKQYYVSGNALNVQAIDEFSLSLVKSKYTDNYANVGNNDEFGFGKIKNKDIGYIYLGKMDSNDPNKIDNVIASLKNHKAIILDIRNNGGGDDAFADRIAGAFADGEHFIYTVQTRNGQKHSDFDAISKHFAKPQGTEQFLKPVIVLTDRYTISAGEVFLPNGWTYQYSIDMFLLPNGKSLDGIGHIPQVYIKNTKPDILANNDKVIEKAIDYLWVTHKIR